MEPFEGLRSSVIVTRFSRKHFCKGDLSAHAILFMNYKEMDYEESLENYRENEEIRILK